MRASQHELTFEVDRQAPFSRATSAWRELWGDQQPQENQRVVIRLCSERQGNPERCWDELLSANQRLAFVTELYLHVRCMPKQRAQRRSTVDPH